MGGLQTTNFQITCAHHDSYRDARTFAANLERLALFNRERGIRSLFVLEANSRETTGRRAELERFHRLMREVAEKYAIPVIDLDAYLAQPEIRDSGFLWWDYVHLTDYGQGLAGRFIAEAIKTEQESLP